jgi:hypothetical protein
MKPANEVLIALLKRAAQNFNDLNAAANEAQRFHNEEGLNTKSLKALKQARVARDEAYATFCWLKDNAPDVLKNG